MSALGGDAFLRVNPNCAATYNNMGNVYGDKGDRDRAIEDFTAALRIDPGNATTKANLAAARKARRY